MYDLLEAVKCKKCGKVLAEPKELIKIETQVVDDKGNTTRQLHHRNSFLYEYA